MLTKVVPDSASSGHLAWGRGEQRGEPPEQGAGSRPIRRGWSAPRRHESRDVLLTSTRSLGPVRSSRADSGFV